MRWATVEHPIGNTSADNLRKIALDAVTQIVGIVTGSDPGDSLQSDAAAQ